jgi:NAD(P)H-hydrate epimerase
MAQGLTGLDSAILGVYLHGLAGDIGASHKGGHSLLASDIIEYIPDAFKELKG